MAFGRLRLEPKEGQLGGLRLGQQCHTDPREGTGATHMVPRDYRRCDVGNPHRSRAGALDHVLAVRNLEPPPSLVPWRILRGAEVDAAG